MVIKRLKLISILVLMAASGYAHSSTLGQAGQVVGLLPQLAQIANVSLSMPAQGVCTGVSVLTSMYGKQSEPLADVGSGLGATAGALSLVDTGMTLDQSSHIIADALSSHSIGSAACTLAGVCASRYGCSLADACPKFAESVVASCPSFALKMALGASLLYGGKKLVQCKSCKPMYNKIKAGYAKAKSFVNSNPLLRYGTYGSVALYYMLRGMQNRQQATHNLQAALPQNVSVVDPVIRMADVCLF